MPWISYAQNGEDVRLQRAFADEPSGFYVDVGANDPVELSVTKHFYDAGWSGINVEPLPKQFALLRAARARDINLNVACSNTVGTLKLFAARNHMSGLSTFTAEEVAAHERNGVEFDALSIEATTLAEVLRVHAANRQVDFLSIDVEGHEREVLEGADFVRFRPRVVLVEATRPTTSEPTHGRWEHFLLRSDYVFAVFDGLNRFYVRREDEHLVPRLALAPNVFDDFVPYGYQRRIDELEDRLAAAQKADLLVRSIAGALHTVGRLARRYRKGSVT